MPRRQSPTRAANCVCAGWRSCSFSVRALERASPANPLRCSYIKIAGQASIRETCFRGLIHSPLVFAPPGRRARHLCLSRRRSRPRELHISTYGYDIVAAYGGGGLRALKKRVALWSATLVNRAVTPTTAENLPQRQVRPPRHRYGLEGSAEVN